MIHCAYTVDPADGRAHFATRPVGTHNLPWLPVSTLCGLSFVETSIIELLGDDELEDRLCAACRDTAEHFDQWMDELVDLA